MKYNYLYSIRDKRYLFDVQQLIKTLLMNIDRVCYVSLNKSAERLREYFKESNIDPKNIVIIDMISTRFKKPEDRKGVYYFDVSDEEKTTKFITNILKKEKSEALIIDSLSTMSVYYDQKNLSKFAHDIIVYSDTNKIINNFIIQVKDEEKEWVDKIAPLVGGISRVNVK